jgi:protocatechuate 3,4-dioxygenase beta subunit
MKEQLSRRDLLAKCTALGALTLGPGVSVADALDWANPQNGTERMPTPWNELGPFYKRNAPHLAQLRAPGDPGLPLTVSGQVFDTKGNAIEGATLEIWQANDAGLYDLDGFKYRASLLADSRGKYAFDSVMPGHYPGRVCQHVHYLVQAPGCKPLTTQLYFATDPVFEGDPRRNYAKDPLIQSADLVRPVSLVRSPQGSSASVTFEIVLEALDRL